MMAVCTMRVLDFIFAARPMLQLPIWSIYLVAMHYHHELSGETAGWSDLLMMSCISSVAGAAMYLNQVFDLESDSINQKVGFIQNGILTSRQLMIGFIIGTLMPLVISTLSGFVSLFILGQLVLLAFLYSAPPFRLKDRAFWGLFANAWGFGLLVSFSVMPDLSVHNAGDLGWDNPVYFLFSVGGVHVLTTIPDRAGDAATDKHTIAVVLGRPVSLLIAAVLFGGAAWIALRSNYPILVYIALFAIIPVLGALVLRSDAIVRLAAKAPILLLTLLAAYWYPAYGVFVVFLLFATRIYYLRRFGIIYPQIA